ncbi:MAG: dipeptidase [Gammaproteobacteria bacterium]|nr:dipeptidase [Gammaproteobacteria bacterium]MDE0283914.1 dipeptidase [Gammaproteobacteria bacterium]
MNGKYSKERKRNWNVSHKAEVLHNHSIVWDNHGCLPLDLKKNLEFIPQLQRYRDAGVDVASINVGYGEIGLEACMRVLAQMRDWIGVRPHNYLMVESVEDIELAHTTGKLAVTFDLEGAAPLQRQINLLPMLYDLGVRWMLLAYNRGNWAGGGCHEPDKGLTAAGKALIDKMNEVGMVVCLSHTGYRTAMEAMQYSRQPVIFSHSNARALKKHDRNIPDELITACAQKGGVIGINGVNIFLGSGSADVESIADHIDYIVQLAGIDHVGIGLDYIFDDTEIAKVTRKMTKTFPRTAGYDVPIEVVAPENFPQLTECLLNRSYTEDDIQKVLGGNLLRIAEQVWK